MALSDCELYLRLAETAHLNIGIKHPGLKIQLASNIIYKIYVFHLPSNYPTDPQFYHSYLFYDWSYKNTHKIFLNHQ